LEKKVIENHGVFSLLKKYLDENIKLLKSLYQKMNHLKLEEEMIQSELFWIDDGFEKAAVPILPLKFLALRVFFKGKLLPSEKFMIIKK